MHPVRKGEPARTMTTSVPANSAQKVTVVLDYFIACGLIGDPVPPVMIKGGPEKKNS